MSAIRPIIWLEDDNDNQEIIKAIIRELQVPNEICFFDNGESMMQFLVNTPKKPFLILCDINLPRINGLQLRKQLNENEYLRKKSIPFVFLTTVDAPVLVDIAYDEAAQGYFKKAGNYSELKQQISLIIEYWTHSVHPNG